MSRDSIPALRPSSSAGLIAVCSTLLPLSTPALPGMIQDGDLVAAGQAVSDTQGGFAGGLNDNDGFGRALAVYPDLDGDGVDELLVGAPNDDTAGANSGALWLLTMNADGTVKGETRITAGLNGFTGPLAPKDHFGSSVATLGDLDGNGVPDIAVGASGDSDTAPYSGAVWILFLLADGTVGGQAKINDFSGGFALGLGLFDMFGSAVAGLGDVDGDGVLDLAVGVMNDSDGGLASGAVWLLALRADGSVRAGKKLGNFAGAGGSPNRFDQFGASLAALGDFDGNGVTELAIGAPNDDQGGRGTGAVWVLGLNSNGHVIRRARIGSGPGGFGGQLDSFDAFGTSLTRVPDANGDGIPELAIGAPGDDDGGFLKGAVWLVFLAAGGGPIAQRKISATEGGFPGNLAAGDRLGAGLAGDLVLSDDGVAELAVGAPYSDDGGSNRGAVWNLFFTVAGETTQPGSGVNPNLLVPGATPPKLGLVWDPVILPAPPATALLGEPLIDFLGVSQRTLVDSFGAGLLTGAGDELLISLDVGDLLYCLQAPAARNFAVPLPGDPSLVGVEIYAQGFRINVVTFEQTYTNGLDIVLGF